MNSKLTGQLLLGLWLTFFAGTLQGTSAEDTVTLRGTIIDASNGNPVPARLYIESKGHDPFLAQSAGGIAIPYQKKRDKSVEIHTSLSADPFTVNLAPGTYTLTAERGKEYHPAKREITLTDTSVDLKLELHRWIDMAKNGWFSGETHIHRPIRELRTLILCEDLNVALPLTAWVSRVEDTPLKNNRNTEIVPVAKLIEVDPEHVIWPLNTEYEISSVNRKRHVLGALFVLNHKKPLDLTASPIGPVAAEARRQGAILDLDKHNWPWSMMLIPTTRVDLFELTNNHLWRTDFRFSEWFPEYIPDYMNIERDGSGYTEKGWIDWGLKNYYALLNCGFDMKPSAGTASGVHPVPLGFGRVYVKLDAPFTYESWIDGLAKGRSFVTTGPMLEVLFDQKNPGTRIQFDDQGEKSIRVEGKAQSPDPLQSVEIVINGEIARTIPVSSKPNDDGVFVSEFDEVVPVTATSWIAVRTFAKRPDQRQRFAHTAPVHIEMPGSKLRPQRVEADYLLKRVRDEIARHQGVLGNEALEEFKNAAKFYESLLD